MLPWLERWKPRSSSRLQITLAATLWTVVGSLLLLFGARWTLLGSEIRLAAALTGLGVLAGLLKGRFVLDRVARRIADRILERGDGRCIGGFLSVRSWLLVAIMATAGRLLRKGAIPLTVLGPLYVAIGTGLIYSARIPWSRRREVGSR